MADYRITLEQSGRSVVVNDQVSLLEALQQYRVTLEYQCQQGYCGACRTPLLQGKVHYADTPLAHLQETEILPCCCTPRADLVLAL